MPTCIVNFYTYFKAQLKYPLLSEIFHDPPSSRVLLHWEDTPWVPECLCWTLSPQPDPSMEEGLSLPA